MLTYRLFNVLNQFWWNTNKIATNTVGHRDIIKLQTPQTFLPGCGDNVLLIFQLIFEAINPYVQQKLTKTSSTGEGCHHALANSETT